MILACRRAWRELKRVWRGLNEGLERIRRGLNVENTAENTVLEFSAVFFDIQY